MTAISTPTIVPPPPPKRYRIGELAEYTGLTRQTIHNYTRWGLIQEVGWTGGGHRLYDESVFARLARIAELKPTLSMGRIRDALAAPALVAAEAPQEAGVPQIVDPAATTDLTAALAAPAA